MEALARPPKEDRGCPLHRPSLTAASPVLFNIGIIVFPHILRCSGSVNE